MTCRGVGADEDITPSDTHNAPLVDIHGPITRARARQLTLEVSSFLSTSLYVNFENRLLPNDFIMIRNNEEDQKALEEELGGAQVQVKLEAQVIPI